ncbi:MAG: hypothetical protein AB1505_36650, partial [Candidatus Latescibacterota bacterium]
AQNWRLRHAAALKPTGAPPDPLALDPLPLEVLGEMAAVLAQAPSTEGVLAVRDLLAQSIARRSLPRQFALRQNKPNPFNASTAIPFAVPAEAGPVPARLEIYDLQGQRVVDLLGHEVQPGDHAVVWGGVDRYGRPAASGVYLYRLQAGPFVAVRRLLLLR